MKNEEYNKEFLKCFSLLVDILSNIEEHLSNISNEVAYIEGHNEKLVKHICSLDNKTW